jgi:hypothetical protein
MKFVLLACFAAPALAADLTIYNQEFAVVRDAVPMDLKAGLNELRFANATAQVEPDSVVLRDPTGKATWQILEQSYRNDPVSQPLLLSLFEGQVIEFIRQESQKPDRLVRGKVIRSGFVPGGENVEPIIEVEGKLVFELPGRPQFPALGTDTVLKPTLAWRVNAPAPVKLDAELAYITGGLTWQASYNLVQPEKGDTIDVVGWVTMKNESGTAFPEAKIKLMAGDVNKVVRPKAYRMPETLSMPAAAAAADIPVVTEKTFDEYHLYTLANRTTLRDKETKQVEFVRAAGVKADRVYVYDGALIEGWQVGTMVGGDPGYGITSNKKVAVYREFKNAEANKLGMPLPKGRVRFYTQDATDNSMQFVGENELDHTPKDELIRLYVGNSFDLVGERRRIDFKMDEGNNRAEESFEIKVRNRKKEPAEIRVVEHLYRWVSWELIEKSQDFIKKDAQTIEFRAPLKPDEEKIITYKVRYTW